MELFLLRPRGFCAGVIRAIQTVEKALELFGPPVFVKHQIVHNRQVVQKLEAAGAVFVEDLKTVPEGSYLIYSAHGVAPQVRREAKKRHLKEIDATCPLVERLHLAAASYAKKGYRIILIGHFGHVEIQGIKAEAKEAAAVVENEGDLAQLNFPPGQKLFYLTQTTLGLEEAEKMQALLKARYPGIETLKRSSVCYATFNRQTALKAVLDLVDLVLIVGDKSSSNSNRLKELAEVRKPAFLIQTAAEIHPGLLKGVEKIALSAGASTPEEEVQKCKARLISLGVDKVVEKSFFQEKVLFPLPGGL
ncbi:MAG: 4-hydroxy-3-methylbut-2-enyl diphosphate reductase [Parachlamydiales bacterium]